MPTILVIEDEAILRNEVIEWLTLEGYTALGAADGMTGVEMAFRQLPDLIVCDITMPRMDGYSVLAELHANPATVGIPFIFVTARVAHNDIRQGMELGADDYITKPFTNPELLQAIQVRLTKKTIQEQERQHGLEQLQQALVQEQERRLLTTKLVAMFSHDFRNPLTSILLFNNLLREQGNYLDVERRLTQCNRIEASVRQLVQMLDDVLLVAQFETGKLDLKLEPLDIGAFLEQIVANFQLVQGEQHRILFESQETALYLMDARLLRQIAANLISNAIKYSAPGTVVRVLVDYDEGQCRLTVQDQGIGIPVADQPHLLEAFRRGSNVGNVPGTGLGLALVQQAVTLLNGSIHFESQVGVGTTMTVMLSLQPYLDKDSVREQPAAEFQR
ncbi:MAG: response regulator [Chloroflexi bacterium]|nr:response regulator [Chloroflexota bacterium]